MQPQAIPQPTLNFVGLTVDEVNVIFAGLDELPQKRARGVTDKLFAQAQTQLNPPPAAPSEPQAEDGAAAPGLSDPE